MGNNTKFNLYFDEIPPLRFYEQSCGMGNVLFKVDDNMFIDSSGIQYGRHNYSCDNNRRIVPMPQDIDPNFLAVIVKVIGKLPPY